MYQEVSKKLDDEMTGAFNVSLFDDGQQLTDLVLKANDSFSARQTGMCSQWKVVEYAVRLTSERYASGS